MIYTPKSGFCLLGSCICAIASIGSVFELTSGNPELGTVVTGSILAIAAPLTAILFIIAVKSAETWTNFRTQIEVLEQSKRQMKREV